MSTSQSTVDFILDQLSSVDGVSARKMFGEYALYVGKKVVALVCDDQLFVKITPAGKKFIGHQYHEAPAYPGAKPSMLIDPDNLEDRAWISCLIDLTAAALPEPKPKSKSTK